MTNTGVTHERTNERTNALTNARAGKRAAMVCDERHPWERTPDYAEGAPVETGKWSPRVPDFAKGAPMETEFTIPAKKSDVET